MNIFVLTTWDEPCGIAGYSKNLVSGLKSLDDNLNITIGRIEKRFFGSLYSKTHPEYWREICRGVSGGDVVHIQHEFSFFGDSIVASNKNFVHLLRYLVKIGAHPIITFHTLPAKFQLREFIREPRKAALRTMLQFLSSWSWCGVARVIAKEKIACLVHSHHSRAILVNAGLPSSLVGVVPAGVGDYFDAPIEKVRAKEILGYTSDDIIIGTFGFIAEYKGVDIACEAIEQLPEKFKLVVAGSTHPDNRNDPTFEKIIKKFKDSKKISFLGFVPNSEMKVLKSAVDIFVAPYRENGLASSAAINVGISAGIPVIASNINAFVEVNRGEDIMSLISQDQPHVLALEIARLEENFERKKELVDSGRRYASRNSWFNVAKTHLKHYQQL